MPTGVLLSLQLTFEMSSTAASFSCTVCFGAAADAGPPPRRLLVLSEKRPRESSLLADAST